jgi:hypothetical protein
MEIAIVSTAAFAKKSDANSISAFGFPYRVQGLVDVSHEMRDVLQCFGTLLPRCILVGQHPQKFIDLQDNAAIRQGAIQPSVVLAAQRDIHVMPRLGLRSLPANVIRPRRDGVQVIVPEEGLNHHLGGFIEVVFGDGGDDLMAFMPPTPTRARQYGYHNDGNQHSTHDLPRSSSFNYGVPT